MIIEKYQINIYDTKFVISEYAASMIGTTANLRKKDVLTIN